MTSNTVVISDLEGFDISKSFNPTQTYRELVLNGDILDSTFLGPLGVRLENKSYNLRNIIAALENPRITNILGNRDINKIKCKYLCKLNGSKTQIENFNNGEIDLSIKTYRIILSEIDSSETWKISNMNAWYTFWNGGVGKGKNWSALPDYLTNPFLIRFYEIFGVDNGVENGGTMSAPNLLNTIFYEYKILNNLSTINNESETNDYKAYVVLAIFKSMLINSNISIETFSNNSSNFKGLLSNLFKKSIVCKYLEINNRLFLLSHGGITKTLINSYIDSEDNIIKKIKNTLETNNNLRNILTSSKTFWSSMKGGYYNSNTDISPVPKEKLIECLNYVNEEFEQSINEILDGPDELVEGKPNVNILFLLMMSAPFNCQNFFNKVDNTKFVFECGNISNTELVSPILPGYRNVRKEFFLINGIQVIQVFGHQPVGYCGTIDLFTNPSGIINSYAVITDFSNTFANSNINQGNSTSCFIINNDNGVGRVDSNIEYIFPNEKVSKSIVNTDGSLLNFNSLQQDIFTKYLFVTDNDSVQSTDKINLNSILDNTELVDLLKISKMTNSFGNYVNYHGCYNINGVSRVIFTLNQSDTMPTMFNKTLFNLTKENYIRFMSNPTDMNGGYSSNYKNKYLKYKQKYLDLKKILSKK
jgi:hypothetical protein